MTDIHYLHPVLVWPCNNTHSFKKPLIIVSHFRSFGSMALSCLPCLMEGLQKDFCDVAVAVVRNILKSNITFCKSA